MKPLDVLIALLVPILWGMGLVVAKPAVDQFPPILLMSLRFGLTALALLWFVPVPKKALFSLFLVALIGSTLQYGLTYNGLRYLDASTTALIVQAEVPFVTLIAAVWLGERLGIRKIIGMVIAFVGIYLIAEEPRFEGQLIGVGLVLSGAFMWAIGQVMMRRLGEIGGLTAIAWIAAMAAPQLFVASLLLEDGQLHHGRRFPSLAGRCLSGLDHDCHRIRLLVSRAGTLRGQSGRALYPFDPRYLRARGQPVSR